MKNLLKSGLIGGLALVIVAGLALVSSINMFPMKALAETTNLIMLQTRKGDYVNSDNSTVVLHQFCFDA